MDEITIIGNYESAMEIVKASLNQAARGSLTVYAKIDRINSYLNKQIAENLSAIEQS